MLRQGVLTEVNSACAEDGGLPRSRKSKAPLAAAKRCATSCSTSRRNRVLGDRARQRVAAAGPREGYAVGFICDAHRNRLRVRQCAVTHADDDIVDIVA